LGKVSHKSWDLRKAWIPRTSKIFELELQRFKDTCHVMGDQKRRTSKNKFILFFLRERARAGEGRQ